MGAGGGRSVRRLPRSAALRHLPPPAPPHREDQRLAPEPTVRTRAMPCIAPPGRPGRTSL